MDPVTALTILGVSYAAKPGVELVKDFLGKVLTPTAEATGEILSHPLREWQRKRVERAHQIVVDAAVIVEGLAQAVEPVPGRLLMPILEKGSLEEDEEL